MANVLFGSLFKELLRKGKTSSDLSKGAVKTIISLKSSSDLPDLLRAFDGAVGKFTEIASKHGSKWVLNITFYWSEF